MLLAAWLAAPAAVAQEMIDSDIGMNQGCRTGGTHEVNTSLPEWIVVRQAARNAGPAGRNGLNGRSGPGLGPGVSGRWNAEALRGQLLTQARRPGPSILPQKTLLQLARDVDQLESAAKRRDWTATRQIGLNTQARLPKLSASRQVQQLRQFAQQLQKAGATAIR